MTTYEFNPDWKLGAADVKRASEEGYKAGREQAFRDVNEWGEGECPHSRVNRIACATCTYRLFTSLEQGRLPNEEQ